MELPNENMSNFSSCKKPSNANLVFGLYGRYNQQDKDYKKCVEKNEAEMRANVQQAMAYSAGKAKGQLNEIQKEKEGFKIANLVKTPKGILMIAGGAVGFLVVTVLLVKLINK